jgi:hypothetical protein
MGRDGGGGGIATRTGDGGFSFAFFGDDEKKLRIPPLLEAVDAVTLATEIEGGAWTIGGAG